MPEDSGPMTVDSGTRGQPLPGLPELWSETLGDPRVVVAVLDGPVNRGHRSLAGAGWR